MRNIILTALLASTALLAACNTARGVGRDAESVGNAAERAVN